MKILLSGGGTIGSVSPLLAVIDSIRKRQPEAEFLFVGTEHGPERALVESAGIRFQSIPAGKLRRYLSGKNVSDVWQLLRGVVSALRIMRQWRPDVIVGAGSYVCVPLGWAGWLCRIPVIAHQQDVIPGLANRLLARVAKKITVTFPTSKCSFPEGKTEVIGNPVRQSIIHAQPNRGRAFLHLSPDRPLVVVLGGGTGSEMLNQLFLQAIGDILPRADVVHLTGPARTPSTFRHPAYHSFTFLTTELPDVLAAATVVVSRAGLGVLSELAALGKPTIVIPMPRTHQEANAATVAQAQAAVVIAQDSITPAQLGQRLISILEDHQYRAELGTNIHRLFTPDAADRLATIILAYGQSTRR